MDYIRDVTFFQKKGRTKELIDIRDLYDPSNSLILYHCLAERKSIISTSIDFKLKETYITAELTNNGAIFIKQGIGSFSTWSYNERAFYGCYFISRLSRFLTEQQNQHKRNMDDLIDDMLTHLGHKKKFS